ncbi:MAG: hypothetical protein JWQ57_364 [Mucilaginibacter sp.]|nr:hypothetical protein [Mucilaginibacter sp.]
MKYLFLFIFITTSFIVKAQDLTALKAGQSKAERVILNDEDMKAMMALYDPGSNKMQKKIIASVQANANKHIPPVLFTIAMVLFEQEKYSDACFWFYVAQLRSRYDVNRSVDKTVSAANWNGPIGMSINEYAFKHLDTLEKVVPKVIAYVTANDELYDQRWINVLSKPGQIKDDDIDKLSVDKNLWPGIKKETIDSYYADFKEIMIEKRQKQ